MLHACVNAFERSLLTEREVQEQTEHEICSNEHRHAVVLIPSSLRPDNNVLRATAAEHLDDQCES